MIKGDNELYPLNCVLHLGLPPGHCSTIWPDFERLGERFSGDRSHLLECFYPGAYSVCASHPGAAVSYHANAACGLSIGCRFPTTSDGAFATQPSKLWYTVLPSPPRGRGWPSPLTILPVEHGHGESLNGIIRLKAVLPYGPFLRNYAGFSAWVLRCRPVLSPVSGGSDCG